jgi:hypothetical protein
MLATVAALHLLVAAQVPAAPPPGDPAAPPGEVVAPGESSGAPAAGEPGAIPPPAPPPAAEAAPAGAAPPAGKEPAPEPAPGGPERAAAPGAARGKPRQQSLLSAEPLRGGSAALAWVGWPSFGAAYAIGFTERDDGGLFLDHDWAKSETRIGVLYRRPLSPAGPFAAGARLALAWYENFGATFVHDENHSDRGIEVAPGLALSRPAGGGIFSTIVEAPMTITTKYENGFLFSPRLSLAFEAPVYPEFTVGARAGVGYRAGAGGAPLREGRGELQFLIVAGYQLL